MSSALSLGAVTTWSNSGSRSFCLHASNLHTCHSHYLYVCMLMPHVNKSCHSLVILPPREEDGQWKEDQKLEAHSDWVRDVGWAPSIGLPTSTIASCSQVRNQTTALTFFYVGHFKWLTGNSDTCYEGAGRGQGASCSRIPTGRLRTLGIKPRTSNAFQCLNKGNIYQKALPTTNNQVIRQSE